MSTIERLSSSLCTVEPLNEGHIKTSHFVHYREVVLFLMYSGTPEWRLHCSSIGKSTLGTPHLKSYFNGSFIQSVLYSECLYSECPLFRVSFIQSVLYSECPLFRVSFIQSVLECPLFRVSFVLSVLYLECPLFRVFFIVSSIRSVLY